MVGGLLLTGGSSRRLGTDKATLPFRGETLAARAARVLTVVCETVVEVGPGVTALPAVRETPPGSGPLAAMVAGASALGTAPFLLLACDMPFVEVPLLDFLARYPGDGAVVPVAGGRPQYTCARYGTASVVEALGVLRTGRGGFKDLRGSIEPIPEAEWRRVAPADAFTDIDTPGDLARFGSEHPR